MTLTGSAQALKKKMHRQVFHRWGGRFARGLALFLFSMMVVSFARAGWDLWKLRQEEMKLSRSITVLEAQNRDLREQIARMQEDAYIEKAAREQLGLVKPGEILYYVPPDSGEGKGGKPNP